MYTIAPVALIPESPRKQRLLMDMSFGRVSPFLMLLRWQLVSLKGCQVAFGSRVQVFFRSTTMVFINLLKVFLCAGFWLSQQNRCGSSCGYRWSWLGTVFLIAFWRVHWIYFIASLLSYLVCFLFLFLLSPSLLMSHISIHLQYWCFVLLRLPCHWSYLVCSYWSDSIHLVLLLFLSLSPSQVACRWVLHPLPPWWYLYPFLHLRPLCCHRICLLLSCHYYPGESLLCPRRWFLCP